MNTYSFADLHVGMTESFVRSFTAEDEESFRRLSGDDNPLHRDDAFAEEMGGGKLRGHVCFGMLTASLLSTLAGMYLPGRYSLIHSVEVSFVRPVYAGDELTVSGTVAAVHEQLRMIELKVRITLPDGSVVCKAKMKILLFR